MRVRPSPVMHGATAYRVPRAGAPTDLHLDGNEGATPPESLLGALQDFGIDVLRRYPDAAPLEAHLATRLGTSPAQVLVTAGGDDALDRACRVVLAPGRELLFPVPGFEMLARYARLVGGTVVEIPWTEHRYPTDAVLAALSPATAMIVVTSPNNPTGGVATAEDLRRLSAAAPEALLLVDLAYVEFADEDLSAAALALPNAVVVRTVSKARGLAGLRVGYVAGPTPIIDWMRAAGAPYAVSAPSLALAQKSLHAGDEDMQDFVARVRQERSFIASILAELGADPLPSEANFVLTRVRDPLWLRDALAGLGIAVRAFPGKAGLEQHVRVACPGDSAALLRLEAALRAALRPEALLLDMDGVLADVSGSYRAAIVQTAASFGVEVRAEDIAYAKALGDANNDWVLTRRLLSERGVETSLEEVTRRFEALYQGSPGRPGLRATERLLGGRALLERLSAKVALAVVTGRPRKDALNFLREQGIEDLFPVLVCMEDAPAKPDPEPVRLALSQLGVGAAWMVGDTPDDVRAARFAGVVPLGIAAPGHNHEATDALLTRAGAARTLRTLDELESLL